MTQGAHASMSNVFPPVGECIYCGSKDELTDEHIIAYGLNGRAILPKSSCKQCAAVTSGIERAFMRGQAWPMRVLLGYQTRRKKEIPKNFPLILAKTGKRETVEIPVSDFPVILQLPLFAMPGFTLGHYDRAIDSNGTVAISLRKNTKPADLLQQIGRKFGADGIEIPPVNYHAFAKLIAKSAYALAVAIHGLNRIDQKFVVPAILGKANDLGTWVGSSPRPLEEEPYEHISQVQTYKFPPTGQEVIVVLFKFFAHLPSPGYMVIAANMK